MKKIYSLISVSALIVASLLQSNAQCDGIRYHDFVFTTAPTVTSNISYGSNIKYSNATQNLLLDVYQPTGDVSTSRALIIMAHGGSFISGSKAGTDVVPLCKDLAKMGYVVASIEYRVGMTNFPFGAHTVDSADAGAAVMRATHDGRAAIRFFRKNAAIGGNTYKIDTNNIYFAGVSAGGFMALHIAYMDQLSEFPNYVDTTGTTVGTKTGQPGMHGGIEGQSGNPGYSSSVKAIVNICGAIGDTSWINSNDIPVLSFHGTNDGTVPYGTALIYLSPPSTYPLLKVHGSSSVAKRANHVGLTNCFDTYWGQDHIPHKNSALYYDTTLVITRNFLEHFTCGVPLDCNYTGSVVITGINNSADDTNISIFPNPANTSVTIDLKALTENATIELYNSLGEKIKNIPLIKNKNYTIQRDNLPSGIYFLNIIADGKIYNKKIMFE